MGIESTFACNALKDLDLAEKGESRFRTLWQSMMSGVSHAQRPTRLVQTPLRSAMAPAGSSSSANSAKFNR
jgi:hypothetical protein